MTPALLAAVQHSPTFQISPKLALIIVAVLVIGAVGRYVEARDREHRRAARTERQRDYRRYLRSELWKQNRAPALERARGLCEDCGAARDLDVHHRTYARKGAEHPEDLVALCRPCHTARHKGDRSGLDWALLAVLRWWRVRRYRKVVA
jgi:5-methylcytosine-specific restriction endonuclease McrA